MKKTACISLFVVFAAVAGALITMYIYLRRREQEVYEYEQMLFNEDFNYEEMPEDNFADIDDGNFEAEDVAAQ